MKLGKIFSNLAVKCQNNAPTILTIVGVASSVAAVGFAVSNTRKAMKYKEDAEKVKGEELTTTEKFITCAPCYIPTAIALTVSIVCGFKSNAISDERIKAAEQCLKIARSADAAYREATKKVVGEKKAEEITTQMNKDEQEKLVNVKSINTKATEDLSLIYDTITCQLYYDNIANVRENLIKANEAIFSSNDNSISVNDYCDFLGINRQYEYEGKMDGDSYGWNIWNGTLAYQIGPPIETVNGPTWYIRHSNLPIPKQDRAYSWQ